MHGIYNVKITWIGWSFPEVVVVLKSTIHIKVLIHGLFKLIGFLLMASEAATQTSSTDFLSNHIICINISTFTSVLPASSLIKVGFLQLCNLNSMSSRFLAKYFHHISAMFYCKCTMRLPWLVERQHGQKICQKIKPKSFKYGQSSQKAKKAVDKPTGLFGLQEVQGLNPHEK